MSMSFADGFRTLQAVRDLRILAALAPVEAKARIASGIPSGWMAPDEAQAALDALSNGCDIDPSVRAETMTAVQAAAALPNKDFQTFLFATALLLQETLQGRSPVADVAHHWSTFRGHYRSAAAVERAAIAQAIRRIGLAQDKPISQPETPADRTTAAAAALKPLLQEYLSRRLAPGSETSPASVAALLIKGLRSPVAANEAAELWAMYGESFIQDMPDPILAGFRHLYEAWDGFSPDGAPLIPLLDPPPGVDWPH